MNNTSDNRMVRNLWWLSHGINSSTIVVALPVVVPTTLVSLWLVHSHHLIAILWGLLLTQLLVLELVVLGMLVLGLWILIVLRLPLRWIVGQLSQLGRLLLVLLSVPLLRWLSDNL